MSMSAVAARVKWEKNHKWHLKVLDEIDEHTSGQKPLEPKVFNYNDPAKWYIAALALKDIPCKVVNLGAGVKKVIVADQVCPHCKGKGGNMKTIYVRMSLKMGDEKNPEQTCEAWLTAKIKGFTSEEVKSTIIPVLGGSAWKIDHIWETEE